MLNSIQKKLSIFFLMTAMSATICEQEFTEEIFNLGDFDSTTNTLTVKFSAPASEKWVAFVKNVAIRIGFNEDVEIHTTYPLSPYGQFHAAYAYTEKRLYLTVKKLETLSLDEQEFLIGFALCSGQRIQSSIHAKWWRNAVCLGLELATASAVYIKLKQYETLYGYQLTSWKRIGLTALSLMPFEIIEAMINWSFMKDSERAVYQDVARALGKKGAIDYLTRVKNSLEACMDEDEYNFKSALENTLKQLTWVEQA